jgi:hypothetical protein
MRFASDNSDTKFRCKVKSREILSDNQQKKPIPTDRLFSCPSTDTN